MISRQFASRLPPIPEAKPFVIEEDASCSGICSTVQAGAQTDACETSETVSSWCYAKLHKALRKLMRSKYAAPFATSKSGSSMSLQAIEQSLVGGRYVDKAEEFWSDVDTCWDASTHICGAEGISTKIRNMANKMRTKAAQMEFWFWRNLFELKQNSSDVCVNSSSDDASDVAWGVDSWIARTVVDVGDWVFSKVVNEM